MKKIVQSVPNFSEGRNRVLIEIIADAFRGSNEIKLLNCSSDVDHNRSVITVAGEPEALKEALIEAAGRAVELIDLRGHKGQHPRMGAVDVIPLVPLKGVTMEETVTLADEVARSIANRYELPVYLYEESASAPYRKNLANVRRGEFEGLEEKMRLAEWRPDYGPQTPHPSAGAVAIGARGPLIAYNVNLGTDKLKIAEEIAERVRHSGGGLHFCKAIGLELAERGIVQVSMNLTNYRKTSIYRAHEMVRMEAKRYGVPLLGGELIGLIPTEALADVAAYYLGLENFSVEQVLETKLME